MVKFYQDLDSGEISDISTMPVQSLDRRKAKKSETLSAVDKTVTSPKGQEASMDATTSPSIGTTSTVKQYWETTTAGRVWFDLCSELPEAGYLSATSDGRLYELKPNMLNVCAAVRVLLGASSSTESQELWKLKDLEVFWNEHVARLSKDVGAGSVRPILTTEGNLRFRAPFSDTETINRELGSIQFVGGRNAIDIELEAAHQLATVKHRLCSDPTKQLWSADAKRSFLNYIPSRSSLEDTDVAVRSVVQSAVLGDALLINLLKEMRLLRATPSTDRYLGAASPERDQRILQALLAARWGEERRQGSDNTDTDGNALPLSVTDASLTTADAKRQVESSVQMSKSALELVTYCKDVKQLAQLVRWVLQEAPPELCVEDIAAILLKIPPEVRSAPAFTSIMDGLLSSGEERGILLKQVLSFGTADCPAKRKFLLFDTLNGLRLSSKLKIIVLYINYRIHYE